MAKVELVYKIELRGADEAFISLQDILDKMGRLRQVLKKSNNYYMDRIQLSKRIRRKYRYDSMSGLIRIKSKW